MLTYTDLFMGILCIAAGFCLYYHHRRAQAQLREMRLGILFLEHATQLLQHLPQHRGMANALLNGDESFRTKLDEMRNQVDHDAEQLDQLCHDQPIADQTVNDWQGVKSDWQALRQRIHQLSPGESFEQHTVLINRLLYLISDACDQMKLSSHPDHTIRQLVDSGFNQLPLIIERIGQARGIGSGAAAKGRLLTAVRIKLRFLHKNLEQGIHHTYQHLRQQTAELDSAKLEAPHRLSQQFLATLDGKLLGPHVTINAADFFEAGTSALNNNLQLMTTITEVLKARIG